MNAVLGMLTALVRPAKGLERAGGAVKWLWLVLAAVLFASVAIKVSVGAPLELTYQMAQADAQMQAEMEKWPAEERAKYEKDQAAIEESGDFVDTGAPETSAIVTVSALVFGVLGAAVSLLWIATFFFVAAKTWANPVKYTTMLTVAGLALLPHAFRNVLQAVYMASTGTWLAHSGLAALVAPATGEAPGVMYALLGQLDLWVLWGLALLVGALLSAAVGFTKKRFIPAFVTFIVISVAAQAVPTIVQSALMGITG